MKKILSVLLAILLMSGVAMSATITTSYLQGHAAGDVEGQGRGQVYEPHRTFRLVRYVHPVSGTGSDFHVSNDMVVIWATFTSGDDGVTVTTSNITMDARVAGIMVTSLQYSSEESFSSVYASQDVGKANWAWLQTYGKANCFMGHNMSAGEGFGTGGDYGKASTLSVPSVDARSHTLGGVAGFIMSPASVDARGLVFIRCE